MKKVLYLREKIKILLNNLYANQCNASNLQRESVFHVNRVIQFS